MELLAQVLPATPSVTIEQMVWIVVASCVSVSVTLISILKFAAAKLPSVDAFFSNAKKSRQAKEWDREGLPGSRLLSGQVAQCRAHDEIRRMNEAITRLTTTVEKSVEVNVRMTSNIDYLVNALKIEKEVKRQLAQKGPL